MAKINIWMPVYVNDLLARTARLTTMQLGAYMKLEMDYWTNGPIPDDDVALASITRLSGNDWAIAKPFLGYLFRIADGYWHDDDLDALKVRQQLIADRNSKGGKARAAQRWGTPNPVDSTAVSKGIHQAISHAPVLAIAQATNRLTDGYQPDDQPNDAKLKSKIKSKEKIKTEDLPDFSKSEKSSSNGQPPDALPELSVPAQPEPEPEPTQEPTPESGPEELEFALIPAEVPASAPAKELTESRALQDVFNYYLEVTHRNPKVYSLSVDRRKKGLARLQEALKKTQGVLPDAVELMKAAIDGITGDAWRMEHNTYEWDLHLFKSQGQFERWLDVAEKNEQKGRKQHA